MTIKLPLRKEKADEVNEESVIKKEKQPEREDNEKFIEIGRYEHQSPEGCVEEIVTYHKKRDQCVTMNVATLKDSLGMVVAAYSLSTEIWSTINEANVMLQMVSALLDAEGKMENIYEVRRIKKDGKVIANYNITYRKFLKELSDDWNNAIRSYRNHTDDWKISFIGAHVVMTKLMRIAVCEGLINMTKEMFDLGRIQGASAMMEEVVNQQRKTMET